MGPKLTECRNILLSVQAQAPQVLLQLRNTTDTESDETTKAWQWGVVRGYSNLTEGH